MYGGRKCWEGRGPLHQSGGWAGAPHEITVESVWVEAGGLQVLLLLPEHQEDKAVTDLVMTTRLSSPSANYFMSPTVRVSHAQLRNADWSKLFFS